MPKLQLGGNDEHSMPDIKNDLGRPDMGKPDLGRPDKGRMNMNKVHPDAGVSHFDRQKEQYEVGMNL